MLQPRAPPDAAPRAARRRDMMVAIAWEVHRRLEALAEGGAHGLERGLAGMAAVVEQRRGLQARARGARPARLLSDLCLLAANAL